MASGSSNRPNSGSKAFDFASDDILCSYEDYVNQNNSDGTHSDQSLPNPTQDFQKSRISRSSVFPTTNVYSQPDESLNQELLSTVERTMKKYADNLMRFLEGISSRLSQLELYCYNLDKSIGEMRSDLSRDHGDADSKLKFLEKHLQEVHRSVQILRDKQELAETQKELAKLQFAQKESSSSSQEERTVASAPENKKNDDVSDTPNTQLALALPSQIPAQPTPPQPATQPVSQLQPYYLPSQLPNPQNHSQTPYLQPDPQYCVPQPPQSQVNPTLHSQQYPQYQQQWSQQVSQPMPPPQQPQMPPLPQQPPMQPGQQPPPSQMRPPSPQSQVYPPYMANQPSNPPPEAMGSSMPTQPQFPGSQQSGGSRPDSMLYGYGGPSARPVGTTQPSPQHIKGGFPAHQGDGYPTGGSHPPPMSSGGTYMLYDGSQQTHYSQSGYPSANPSVPNMPPPNNNSLIIRSPAPQQYVRNHPYNELIDKLVSMGYRADHVVSVIQRLEESGQSVDFNAVLDRLNGHSSGSSQRSW